jgi:hypothetical protein
MSITKLFTDLFKLQRAEPLDNWHLLSWWGYLLLCMAHGGGLPRVEFLPLGHKLSQLNQIHTKSRVEIPKAIKMSTNSQTYGLSIDSQIMNLWTASQTELKSVS